MDQTRYRESRRCRLLGNPVIYQLVVLLANSGPLAPSQLAKAAGRSIQAVSAHLAKLRAAETGPVRHGWEAGSLLAEAQAGHEQTLSKP